MGLVVWLFIPVALGGMMRLIFGGGSPDITAHVFVVDQDRTFVVELLLHAAGRAGSILKLEDVTLEDGTRRIGEGEATALLIIPKGFQDAVLNETPSELELVTNPAQRILPGIVEEALKMFALGAFYVQRLFGEPLRQIAAQAQSGSRGPTDAAVSAVSVQINQRINEPVDVAPAARDESRDEDGAPPTGAGGELRLRQSVPARAPVHVAALCRADGLPATSGSSTTAARCVAR